MDALRFRTRVLLGIGAAALTGMAQLWLPSNIGQAAAQSLGGPIPGLESSNQHPVENLRPIRPPSVKPLNMDAAKRAAANADQRRLDQQGVSGSWAFPRNRRP